MSDLQLADRRNTIALVVGRKGSGKSWLIAKRLGPLFPRRITIDWTGEGRELYPNAREVFGVPAVIEAIGDSARESDRWQLIAVVDPGEVPQLLRVLAPRYDGGKRPSLSAAVGGLAIECAEIDVIAPASGGPASSAVTDAIARGRHVRLSFLLATQRPAQCARILSSQADQLLSFRMHEPRDLRWLRDAGGEMFAQRVRRLSAFHYCRYDARTGQVTEFDPRGREVGATDPGDGQGDML